MASSGSDAKLPPGQQHRRSRRRRLRPPPSPAPLGAAGPPFRRIRRSSSASSGGGGGPGPGPGPGPELESELESPPPERAAAPGAPPAPRPPDASPETPASYSPFHALLPALELPPTPASFLIGPDDGALTPLPSDAEEELNGLGLIEAMMNSAADAAAAATAAAAAAAAAAADSGDREEGGEGPLVGRGGSEGTLAGRWTDLTRRRRLPILLFCLLLLCPVGLLLCLPRLVASTGATFVPPAGSDSDRALGIYRRAYGTAAAECGGAAGDGGHDSPAAPHRAGLREGAGLSPSDPLNPPLLLVMEAGASGPTNGTDCPTLIDGSSELYLSAKAYAMGIEDHLREAGPLADLYPIPCRGSPGTSTGENDSTALVDRVWPELVVNSFYSFSARHLGTTLAPGMASSDGAMAVVQISFSVPPIVAARGNLQRKYIEGIMEALRIYENNSRAGFNTTAGEDPVAARGFSVSYTGLRYLQKDLTESVQSSLHRMDVFVLPVALTVLVAVLLCTGRENGREAGSTRGALMKRCLFLVVIPLLTLGTTVALWSAVMYLLCRCSFFEVGHFTPTIMMSLTVGMGFDYVMFMMSRALSNDVSKWRLAVDTGRNDDRREQNSAFSVASTAAIIVEEMTRTAGHTVIVSGITLSLAFLGLTILPMTMLRSAGLGAAIAILSSAIVNLTLIPSLLQMESLARILLLPAGSDIQGGGRKGHRRGWFHRRTRSVGGGGLNLFGSDGVFPEGDRRGGDGWMWLSGLSFASRGAGRGGASQNEDQEDVRLSLEEEGDGNDGYTSFRDLAQPLLMDDGGIGTDEPQRIEERALRRHPDRLLSSVKPCSLWSKVAIQLLHPRRSAVVLCAIVAAALPIALQSRFLDMSISFDLMLPGNSPAMITSRALGEKLGQGSLSPYRIIFDGRNSRQQVDTEEGFQVMHDVVSALINQTDISQTSASLFQWPFIPSQNTMEGANSTTYSGIAHLRGIDVPHALFASAKVCAALGFCPSEDLRALSMIDEMVTATDRNTTYITATLAKSPFDDDGIAWLLAARTIIKSMYEQGTLRNYTVVIEGGAAVEYDVVTLVYASAPTTIGITLVVIFLVMAFFFRSLIAPLRSVVSICLTQGFAFGVLALTHKGGMIDATAWHSLHGTSEVSWLAPVMAFSIVVGLGLDYEIFLIDRVLEFRLAGASHESSIVAGFQETGPIISAAGVIMAIAFGGLMMSSSPALYQWSFLLTVAVLFDTCIGRIIRVILLGRTGGKSWWPRSLPEEATDLLGMMGADRGESAEIEEADRAFPSLLERRDLATTMS